MKIRYYYFLLILCTLPGQAQWKPKAGINLVPLISSSVEVTTEFQTRDWYSVTFDLGGTFRTRYTGLADAKVYDFYRDRTTSGFYTRAGVRLYTPAFGRNRNVKFYANPLAVFSAYRNTAMHELGDGTSETKVYESVSVRGNNIAPALRMGFDCNVSSWLSIDFGHQMAMNPGRTDFLGRRSRNYQPGLGSRVFDDFYLQGFLSLKAKLR